MFDDDDETYFAEAFNRAVERSFETYEQSVDRKVDNITEIYCDAIEGTLDAYADLMAQANESLSDDEQWNLQASFVDVVVNEVQRLSMHKSPEEFQVNYAAVYSLLEYTFGYIDDMGQILSLSEMLFENEQQLREWRDFEIENPSHFDPALIKEAADLLHVYGCDFNRQSRASFYPGVKPKTLH